jgi:hypothetical protein
MDVITSSLPIQGISFAGVQDRPLEQIAKKIFLDFNFANFVGERPAPRRGASLQTGYPPPGALNFSGLIDPLQGRRAEA